MRIVADEGNVTSLGSGTLVLVTQDFGLVITNWHVVRGAKKPVEVIFPDGFRSAGTVMKLDNDWDLAAIGIWRPQVAPVLLADTAPVQGDWLSIAGYGGGRYRAAVGRCTQYVAPGKNQPFEMVELSTEARQGDSGGPIFNAKGELAGVLLGAKRGHTVGSFCGRVGHFLNDAAETLQQQQLQRQESHRLATGTSSPAEHKVNNWVAAQPVTAAVASPTPRDLVPERPAAIPETSQSTDGLLGGTWRENASRFLGPTPYDQIKSFFATVGAFSLLLSCIRLFKIRSD